jgi:hypothetical protein
MNLERKLMKCKVCLLFSFSILLLSLAYTANAESSHLHWRDEFSYGSVSQMQDAGWTLTKNPSGVSLEAGAVLLNGTQADTEIAYFNHFPDGIVDWSIEIRALWPGQGHSQPVISANTVRHQYGFAADGWTKQFALYRDNTKIMVFGSYIEQKNTWVTLKMEKQGNALNLYCNDQLVRTYLETDTQLSKIVGVSIVSPWKGDQSYDYYQLSASGSQPSVAPSFLSNPWVIGGIAAVAGVGVLAGILYFFVIGGGGAGASVGAGGAGSVLQS